MWTTNLGANELKYTMVEYFSGTGNVSKMFKESRQEGVASFELRDSPSMDINSACGLSFLVNLILICIYAFVSQEYLKKKSFVP